MWYLDRGRNLGHISEDEQKVLRELIIDSDTISEDELILRLGKANSGNPKSSLSLLRNFAIIDSNNVTTPVFNEFVKSELPFSTFALILLTKFDDHKNKKSKKLGIVEYASVKPLVVLSIFITNILESENVSELEISDLILYRLSRIKKYEELSVKKSLDILYNECQMEEEYSLYKYDIWKNLLVFSGLFTKSNKNILVNQEEFDLFSYFSRNGRNLSISKTEKDYFKYLYSQNMGIVEMNSSSRGELDSIETVLSSQLKVFVKTVDSSKDSVNYNKIITDEYIFDGFAKSHDQGVVYSKEKNIFKNVHVMNEIFECKKDKRLNKNHPPKIDYVAKSKRDKETGDKAEKYVLEYEKTRLNNQGLHDFAEQVKIVDSDDYGYDIESYNLEGKKILIEVKGSISKKKNRINFFMSANEIDVMSESYDQNIDYYIYYVSNISKYPDIYLDIIHAPTLLKNFESLSRPVSYEIIFKAD